MRLISVLAVILALLALAAWLTRPGIAEFDAMMKTEVERWIARTDVDAGSDAIATVALVGCKLKPSACFDLLRQTFDIKEENRTLYTRFSVKGLGRETTCTGAFTRIWCAEPVVAN
ncbi:MAG: hypothetical protein KDE03_15145 [Rhodobacteraceae bacterium]|nr:hypothetical protein [Paracoccaceae bacterium]